MEWEGGRRRDEGCDRLRVDQGESIDKLTGDGRSGGALLEKRSEISRLQRKAQYIPPLNMDNWGGLKSTANPSISIDGNLARPIAKRSKAAGIMPGTPKAV